MSFWNDFAPKFVEWIMTTSWQASLLAGLIVFVQWTFRSILTARWRYLLWLLLVVRLVIPSLPESPTSVYRYVPASPITEMAATESDQIPIPIFSGDEKPTAPISRPFFSIPSPVEIKQIVFCIWLTGVLVLLTLFIWRNAMFHRLISRCGNPVDARVRELAQSLAADMNMRRSISIIEIAGLDNPAVTGLFKYMLLLPEGMVQQVSRKTLEMIFRHELAHLKRGDLWINFLTSLLQVFHWFNPILWWAFARMRDDRELATDALALSFSKSAGEDYGNTLLELASGSPSRVSLSPAVGILENHRQMFRRIEQIALFKPNAYAWSSLGAVLLVILGLLALTKTPARGVMLASSSQRVTGPVAQAPISEYEAKQKGIAAMVNQKPIYWVQVAQQSAATVKVLTDAEELSGNAVKARILETRWEVRHALIERQLIIDSFKAAGGFIPEDYIDERINDIVKDEYGGDRKGFLDTLDRRKVSLDKYKEEIENNAIVGYMRSKNVAEKVTQYYLENPDLFPADERLNVTMIGINGSTPISADEAAGKIKNPDPKAVFAEQILAQIKAGADFSALAKKYHDGIATEGTPVWISKDGPSVISPFSSSLWDTIDKLEPGQTSEVITSQYRYARAVGAGTDYHSYFIIRLNERRPASVPAPDAPESKKQYLLKAEADKKQYLLNVESLRIQNNWLDGLRSKASVYVFPDPEASKS